MRLLAITLLMLATACGTSTAPDPMTAAAGLYYLRTVNDSALPYVESTSNGTTISIASATLRLRSDSTFGQSTFETWSSAAGTSTVQSVAEGTFILAGSTLTIKFSGWYGGATEPAMIARDTIWLQNGDRAMVYSKYQ